MARKVKCKDTGEITTSDIAYKAPDGKYYSNKRAYEIFEINKTYRKKCVDEMFDILGYKSGMIIPGVFNKKLTEYDSVGYNALYNTMKSQRKNIDWALKTKQFNGESAKVLYIMAILNNNVMDEYKKIIREKKEISTSAKNENAAERYGFEIEQVTSMTLKNSNTGNKIMDLLGDMDE